MQGEQSTAESLGNYDIVDAGEALKSNIILEVIIVRRWRCAEFKERERVKLFWSWS